MCDFSLSAIKSRPAKVGDKLVTHNFGTGTRGFCDADDDKTAVCLMPGTEIAFEDNIMVYPGYVNMGRDTQQKTAIFRQLNKETPSTHHDCLELPDGRQILLTHAWEGQRATVLQLPAEPKTKAEAEDQKRVEFVG